MSEKVKAAVIEGEQSLSIKEFNMPTIGEDEAILKVELVGVCSTDGTIYSGDGDFASPVIPGHEVVGHIVDIGEKAAQYYRVKEGDRVVVYPFIRCGNCQSCREGEPIFCDERRAYGTFVSSNEPPHLWGGYSEYMYISPGSSLFPVSEKVSAEAAILTSAVLGNGVRWVQSGDKPIYGEPVVILGPGPQGLAATIAASEAGASPIIVTGMAGDESRLEMAEMCGADITINISHLNGGLKDEIKYQLAGDLPITAVDVTGTVPGVQSAINVVGKGGTAVIASLMGANSEVPVEIDEFRRKDAWIKGVFSHREEHVEHATKLIEDDSYPLESMVTSKFDLENSEEAIRTVMGEENLDQENIKVAIQP